MTPPSSVSVVVTAHNPRYLDEMLRSIAGQDVHGLDVVVVDDGSDPAITLSPDLPVSVRVVRHDEPTERARARNAGLREARGDWVMVVDHDDLLARGALHQMLAVAEAQGCDAVFGRISRIDAEASAPYEARCPRSLRTRPIYWWDVFCSSEDFGMVLARTEAARRVGFVDEFVPADDYLYAIGIAGTANAVRVERIVGAWRRNPYQTTASAGDEIAAAARRVRRHVMASHELRGAVRRRTSGFVALHSDAHKAWRERDARAFRRAVWRAAMLWPPLFLSMTGLRTIGAAAKTVVPGGRARFRNR